MVGFGADNASVMMGKANGLQAILKEKFNKNIIVFGCACHSFYLCSSAAATKLPTSVEELIRAHFSQSSKKIASFKEFQAFANIKPLKILKPSQTRWLSVQVCIV